jgi:hypothetical protein
MKLHRGSLNVVETIQPSPHANSHAGSCAAISELDLSDFSIEFLLQRARIMPLLGPDQASPIAD